MSMTTAEILALVQAYAEGKQIQFRCAGSTNEGWIDVLPRERFDLNFYSYDYRIKPEPRAPREWWIAWCEEHGPSLKAWSEAPVLMGHCPACHIVHVREVLAEDNP